MARFKKGGIAMCCTTLFAQPMTMVTSQVTRAAAVEVCRPRQNQDTGFKPVRMNWVVVTDENGNRQLRVCWFADQDT
jgi:hypothetical protein